MSAESMCYVGIWPCGCCLAASVIEGSTPKEMARFVADIVKRGGSVEQRTVGWVRENMKLCPHRERPKKRTKQSELALAAAEGGEGDRG